MRRSNNKIILLLSVWLEELHSLIISAELSNVLDQHYKLQAHSPNKLYANVCRCVLRSPTLVSSTRQPVLWLTFLNNNDFAGYWEVVNFSQENEHYR